MLTTQCVELPVIMSTSGCACLNRAQTFTSKHFCDKILSKRQM